MKLYTLAFGLIIGAAMMIGNDFSNIAWAAGMILASGLCIALEEVRER